MKQIKEHLSQSVKFSENVIKYFHEKREANSTFGYVRSKNRFF